MAVEKIQLRFHNSSLSDTENELAEKAGMLALAADYVNSKRVNKADKIVGIFNAAISLYLVKTKTNAYITLNPSSKNEIKIPITQLPKLEELKTYFSEEKNLEISKIRSQLTNFTIDNKTLKGGIPKTDLPLIIGLLKAQRKSNNAFRVLPPLRSAVEIKTDIDAINSSVYNEDRLNKEVDDLINLISARLQENLEEKKALLSERESYWVTQLKSLEAEEKKNIATREKQLVKEIKDLEKLTERQKQENIQQFIEGVAKNIRKDEKAIESHVQHLESLISNPGLDPVTDIEKSLDQLDSGVDTFRAAVSFAKDSVRRTQNREGDIEADAKLEQEDLERKCEIDQQQILQTRIDQEAVSENEKIELSHQVNLAEQKINEFNSIKNGLKSEIMTGVRLESNIMIEPELLGLTSAPTQVELIIPLYIFKYERKGNYYYVVIPPIKVPDSMKKLKIKNAVTGKYNSVFYIPIHEDVSKITSWLESNIANNLELRTSIDGLTNIANEKQQNYQVYSEAKSLMINTLQVAEKDYKSILGRIGDLIA